MKKRIRIHTGNIGIVCNPYLDFVFTLIKVTIKTMNEEWATIQKIEKNCITLNRVGSMDLIKIEWKEF